MMTYSFEQRVVPLIQWGSIHRTFRAPSLRHARPGERIRLIDKPNCRRIIPDPVCFSVERCEITWKTGRISQIREAGIPVAHFSEFSRSLGYPVFEDLQEHLAQTLGPTYIEGFLIAWIPPTPADAEVAA